MTMTVKMRSFFFFCEGEGGGKNEVLEQENIGDWFFFLFLLSIF